MNVHPLLVHFPIAFLATYGVFELLRFKILLKQSYWFYVKAVMVIAGVLSGGLAILSGLLVENLFPDQASLIAIHSHINEAATAIFAVLAFCYVIAWIKKMKKFSVSLVLKGVWQLSLRLEHLILETKLVFLFAIVGLVLIFVGGGLGGLIVYGPNLDPFTKLLFQLLPVR